MDARPLAGHDAQHLALWANDSEAAVMVEVRSISRWKLPGAREQCSCWLLRKRQLLLLLQLILSQLLSLLLLLLLPQLLPLLLPQQLLLRRLPLSIQVLLLLQQLLLLLQLRRPQRRVGEERFLH